jgi:hypothetical protein
MALSVGIAVPGYAGHIRYIYEFLDSYENGTVKPDKVVFSLSSMQEPFVLQRPYSFPIEIVQTREKIVAGGNRNIAKSKLDTDIVTFMDIDDRAHPQRIEFIKKTFEENADIDMLLHNYVPRDHFGDDPVVQDYTLVRNGIRGSWLIEIDIRAYPSTVKPTYVAGYVMHSQPTVRAQYAKNVHYYDKECEMIDDVMYIHSLIQKGARIAYLENTMSFYRPHS